MDKNNHFLLSYLPLIIRLRCCEPVSLPAYLGSTLHGIMGWALLPHKQAYQYLFENRRYGGAAQDIVNPYIIDVPPFHSRYEAGDELCFRFILVGNAVGYAPEVVKALVEKRNFGLGAEKKRFELLEITQGHSPSLIWQQGQGNSKMGSFIQANLPQDLYENCHHCSLTLLTPLRIRRGGELVINVDFPTIIRNITRRMAALTKRYGGEVDQAEIEHVQELSTWVCQTSSGLYVNHLDRYSSRHNEKMDMSGVMGAITFEGDLTPFTPWLNVANTVHIGRNVTLGFGKIDAVLC